MNPFSIFEIRTQEAFRRKALEIFRYQAQHVPVYAEYLSVLGVRPHEITRLEHIPFLPIDFFKKRKIIAAQKQPEAVFSSGGTTGTTTSNHFVHSLAVYTESFMRSFQQFYGSVQDYCVLALLPSYLEREGSSLVYMAQRFIEHSNAVFFRKGMPGLSGFYLNEYDALTARLRENEANGQKSLLLGVSFALLDFAERFSMPLKHTLVMETGGMKGRRRELTRHELHQRLKQAWSVPYIHSEYGMTELLSQAYSVGKGVFATPPWMRVVIRDAYDPLSLLPYGQTGGINVVDLANVYSCAFVATQDLGRKHVQGFEVLGRFDNSDVRGCNLLLEGA